MPALAQRADLAGGVRTNLHSAVDRERLAQFADPPPYAFLGLPIALVAVAARAAVRELPQRNFADTAVHQRTINQKTLIPCQFINTLG